MSSDRVTTSLHEIQVLVARHAGSRHLAVPGLNLVSVDRRSEPTSSLAEPVFAFLAQGAKRIAIGEHVYDYGPGDYLVVPLDLPVTGQFTRASPDEPFLGLSLGLQPLAITGLLEDAGALPVAGHPGAPDPALQVGRADPPLLDAIVRLLRLLDHPGDAVVLGPLLEREILWRLLNGPAGTLLREIGGGDSALAHVGRAVRWIRDHYPEAFKVQDLATQASMSVSSFHRHFRSATTMGPVQYQKKVRLQHARLLLASRPGDVTRVAHDVGYQSASQFTREYRREFGLPPTRDLAGIAPSPGAVRPVLP